MHGLIRLQLRHESAADASASVPSRQQGGTALRLRQGFPHGLAHVVLPQAVRQAVYGNEALFRRQAALLRFRRIHLPPSVGPFDLAKGRYVHTDVKYFLFKGLVEPGQLHGAAVVGDEHLQYSHAPPRSQLLYAADRAADQYGRRRRRRRAANRPYAAAVLVLPRKILQQIADRLNSQPGKQRFFPRADALQPAKCPIHKKTPCLFLTFIVSYLVDFL